MRLTNTYKNEFRKSIAAYLDRNGYSNSESDSDSGDLEGRVKDKEIIDITLQSKITTQEAIDQVLKNTRTSSSTTNKRLVMGSTPIDASQFNLGPKMSSKSTSTFGLPKGIHKVSS